MSPKVHAVVQNAGNFDLSVIDNTEEREGGVHDDEFA
jgi:hypothetical protein